LRGGGEVGHYPYYAASKRSNRCQVVVDISSLTNTTIEAIHTFACDPVHPAWVNELTTPIATAMAVMQLSDGRLVRIAPCEVELDPGKYPSLGLDVMECDAPSLLWQASSGRTYVMQRLPAAAAFVPFSVQSVAESDPLGEGAVSEIVLGSRSGSRIVFRHIMPPMTLGIALARPGQVPNS
jgi:hypothetical protein